MFRRTNLYQTLDIKLYPIKNEEPIYSPGVSIIKDAERKEWTKFPIPYPKLAFISCPGIRHPILVDDKLKKEDITMHFKHSLYQPT